MKKTFKNYFKLGILLFGISIGITSCQKDDELIVVEDKDTTQVAPQLKATVSNFKTQLKGNTSAKNRLSKFRSSNSLSRTLHSDTYNFSIDTTRVQKIETEYYTSFTFIVEREQINLDVVENYVLTQFNDDTFTQHLISYPIINSKPDILTGSIEAINDDSLLYAKDPQCESLLEYVQPICIDFNCGLEGEHSPGEACNDGVVRSYSVCSQGGWVYTTSCSGGGSAGGGTPDPTLPGAGTDPTDPVVVVPLVPAWQQVVSCINGNNIQGVTDPTTLNSTVLGCIPHRDYNYQMEALYAYLDANSCNESAQAFGVAASEAICNGEDVDIEEQIIYDNTWLPYPCQKKIVKDALESCSPLTEELLNIFQASDYSNLNFTVSNNITGNGQTSPQSVYDPNTSICTTTIKIRDTYVGATTDISLARTAIHESVHAILVYLFESGELTYDITGQPLTEYENLVNAHVNHSLGLPANLGKTHHQVFVEYVYKIAVALENYAIAAGHTNSYDYYIKLAWGGLYGTSTFNSLYPQYLNPSDASANPTNYNPAWLDIINTGAAEQDNTTYIFNHPNGTTYTYAKKGNTPNASAPCN